MTTRHRDPRVSLDGSKPTDWATRFDVTNWGLISAQEAGRRVGGAVVAFHSAGVSMLEGRSDLAVLWDIRVRPEARSSGIGTLLFRPVEAWARARSCRTLKAETQNTNVPACRFYRRMGCALRSIDRLAYVDLPDEIRLMWSKELWAQDGAPPPAYRGAQWATKSAMLGDTPVPQARRPESGPKSAICHGVVGSLRS